MSPSQLAPAPRRAHTSYDTQAVSRQPFSKDEALELAVCCGTACAVHGGQSTFSERRAADAAASGGAGETGKRNMTTRTLGAGMVVQDLLHPIVAMCVCVCACMYVCMYVCMYTYVYIYIDSVYVYVHAYSYIYIYVCVCM